LATGDLFNKETKVKNVFIDGKLYDIKPPDPARPGPGGRGPRGGPPVAAPETWSLTINSPQGPLPGTLTIRPDGGSLRGEIDTQFGTVPISNASLKGDELSFDFTVEVQGQSMPVSAKGRIAGDAINGTMETAGQSFVFNGTRKPSRQQ
ncbi:MAG TPA: hypothetical protein VJ302_34550, partial [Blastocatellia bacterium]|nr:hypothetical protein [Blastocatellia bacterium]